MQYTGLKDKNGKEIYDSDILQAEEAGEKLEPVVVVWDTDGWLIHTVKTNLLLSVRDWTEYEVIGNRFENPELLKSQ